MFAMQAPGLATEGGGGRTRCGDAPCAAQTQPPPTNPERLPSPQHTDALAESWCAPLHQAVPCAQRQDVVVAHQRGGGGYFTNQFTPARERKCRLRWSGGRSCAEYRYAAYPEL